MRLIDIFLTASGNIFRSKLRTFLTMIAIFIGAFTLTLTNGLGAGISSYIDKQVSNLGAKDVMLLSVASDTTTSDNTPKKYDPAKKVGTLSAGFGPAAGVLTNADITKISHISGIKSVDPFRSVSPDYITTTAQGKYQIGISRFISGSHLTLTAGQQVDTSATVNQVILPVSYISSLGFSSNANALGQTVNFGITNALGRQTQIPATIVGIQEKSLVGGTGATANAALLDALYAWQSQGLPAAATDQYAAATARFDVNDTPAQITDLKARLKTAGYTGQTVDDQIGTFKSVINGIILVLDAFAAIALLAASFGIVNTLLMSVQERTKEIGLMKAMGMSSVRIFLLFSTEAVALGFWGGLIGVGAAELVGHLADRILSHGFLKDLAGLQLLSFPPASAASIIGLVMLIALLAGTLPAYRAARQSPIDSLRYE